ncbi:hypothetical protein NSZ01_13480 [Nocardioides szechwanensis]|uniref:DUF5667 domain-containing protein n=1 Tax=Nocardioides szechwanensis TaxID=1005944 RepID=A0A1H0BYW8_9ACTN|nr:DUF5667 domain-containing protein [Nocardioides szechwanensis]GEP33580.1 hypothetical protein NSZ01_13480 [Nocardioides szechwanensis]SDN50700.1 hypothetical protein SAMN05192576_2271 [Nocardioides szechwanensis]
MTPAFTARKRAEEFNSLVENASTSELTRARYVDVLELVEAMRHAAPVEAHPAFVANLRERLMLAADAALAPATDAELKARLTVAPRRTPRERRIAVAIGGFAIVGATTSMAVAAQTALPGDTLYPLKRALENAHAGVQVDEGDKGETLLANASGRLDEVDELSRQGAGQDGLAIAETLQAFADQATAASDLLIASYQSTGQEGSIAELREFAADSIAALEQLEGVVPNEARAALIQAVQVLSQIDEQALFACPSCAPGGPVSIPQELLDHVASTVTGDGEPESAPPVGTPDGKGKGNKGKGNQGPGGTTPPEAEPGDGSGTGTPPVQQPGGSDGDPTDEQTDDPIGDITKGLTGGATSIPSSLPELGNVIGDVVEDVTEPLLP